jgi:hypothetical protein
MAGNNDNQQGTDPKEGAEAQADGSSNSGDSTQKNDSQDTGRSEKSAETLYTQDQVNELLSKIRSDEKKKHQGKLDENSTTLKTQLDKMKELEEQLSGAQKKLEKLQEGKKSDKDGLSKELEELRAEREKLQKGMDELAAISAQQIVDTELRMKKELLIQKHGIKFPELVSGDTVEELEASAKMAAEREKALVEQAAKDAEERTKKQLSDQAAAGLPEPISTNASLGNGNDLPTDLSAREKIVKLPRNEYLKKRAEILQEAKRKAGL